MKTKMGRFVDRWRAKRKRPKYDGPDALIIDGEKLIFEEKNMPVLVELNKAQYNSTIRMVKQAGVDRLKFVRSATYVALKRLGVARNLSKAAKKTPRGSDQHNTGNLVTWLARVSPKDKKAVRQIVAIDATAVTRMG